MPRYFFTLDNSETDRDDEGTVLANDQAARAAAVMFLAEHLRDDPHIVWDGKRLSILVDDEDGRRLMEVTVAAQGPIAAT